MRGLALGLLLLSGLAWAQADLPDAGLPDAPVGETGAERSSEEEDANLETPCLSDRDCDRGFMCANGTCRWQRYRDATLEGCSAAGGLWWCGAGLVLARRARRQRLSNFTK